MKYSYLMKAGIGLLAVAVIAVLEVAFGLVTGASGLISVGLDPTVQLIIVSGVMIIVAFIGFLLIRKSYMK